MGHLVQGSHGLCCGAAHLLGCAGGLGSALEALISVSPHGGTGGSLPWGWSHSPPKYRGVGASRPRWQPVTEPRPRSEPASWPGPPLPSPLSEITAVPGSPRGAVRPPRASSDASPLPTDTSGENIAESLVAEGLASRREGIRANKYVRGRASSPGKRLRAAGLRRWSPAAERPPCWVHGAEPRSRGFIPALLGIGGTRGVPVWCWEKPGRAHRAGSPAGAVVGGLLRRRYKYRRDAISILCLLGWKLARVAS